MTVPLKDKLPSTLDNFIIRPRYYQDSGRGPRAYIKIIKPEGAKNNKDRFSRLAGVEKEVVEKVYSKLTSESGYSEFLLTGYSTQLSEKVQVTQTFGDAETVYYFGRAPVFFNITGVVFDDIDNRWFLQFLSAYFAVMRGTSLASSGELLLIVLPNVELICSISSFGYSQDSNNDAMVPFNISVIVKSMKQIPARRDFSPTDNRLGAFKGTSLEQSPIISRSQSEINTIKYEKATELKMSSSGRYSEDNTYLENGSGGQYSTTNYITDAGILSPVYGILATLTKYSELVAGNIQELLAIPDFAIKQVVSNILAYKDQFEDIRDKVQDVADIYKESAANIEGTIQSFENIKKAIDATQNTVGEIVAIPKTTVDDIKLIFKSGSYNSNGLSYGSGAYTSSTPPWLSRSKYSNLDKGALLKL